MPDIVHVACKLAAGLMLDGVLIAGSAYDRDPNVQAPQRFGGYALTLNVPAKTWDRWVRANEASRMVTQDLIFADDNLLALKAKAISLGHLQSGFEPK